MTGQPEDGWHITHHTATVKKSKKYFKLLVDGNFMWKGGLVL